jgi:outer membrane protein OmpA-like peptidoglycan-associated protein
MKKILLLFLTLLSVQFLAYAQNAEVSYSVHMANIGWGGNSFNGDTAGTTGQKRQIEAMKAQVTGDVKGGIRYNVHVQNVGWTGWGADGEIAGTTGKKLQLEAIRVELTGELAKQYNVQYRVHMANIGWSGWLMNGEIAGTTGQKRQLEAIQVKLLPINTANEKIVSEIANDIGRLAIQDTTVRVTSEGIAINIENIQFQPDSSILLAQELRKINQIGEILKLYPNRNIQVSGHTALVGTEESCLQLSRERAGAVAAYLIQTGVRASNKIVIKGLGAEQPVGDNNTEEGRKKNRRVEIILLDE